MTSTHHFLQSSVNHFVAQHEERVHRAAQFSQLTDAECGRLSSEHGAWP